MRWICVLMLCFASIRAHADPPSLEARLAAVSRAPEAAAAAEPRRQARRALDRAREVEATDVAAAERAERIADAALILCERIIARARARASLRAAIAERDDALRRKEVAEAALERAR